MYGLRNKKLASTKAAFLSSEAGLGSSQGLGLRPELRAPSCGNGAAWMPTARRVLGSGLAGEPWRKG